MLVIDSERVEVVEVVLDIVPVVKLGTIFALAGKTYIKNSNKSFRIAHQSTVTDVVYCPVAVVPAPPAVIAIT